MSCTIPNLDTQRRSVTPFDAFFAQVVRDVQRQFERARLEEQLSGVPRRFSYCLRETSDLTGLPVPLLRRLIRADDITAHKIAGWWMIEREEFLKLLPHRLRRYLTD